MKEAAKLAQFDAATARTGLRRALVEAGGPLIDPVPDRDDVVLVTFVVMDSPAQPWVRCQVFDGVDAQAPLQRLDPLPDVWWAERVVDAAVATTYQFQSDRVEMPSPETFHDPQVLHDLVSRLVAASFPDPFNNDAMPAHDQAPQRSANRHDDDWESVLTLPSAEHVEWGSLPTSGFLEQHELTSEVFGNTRRVSVWSPPGGCADLPVVILLDGESFLDEIGAASIVDQLVCEGRIEPIVLVLVHNATELSRMTELTCHPSLNGLIADELLPWLRATYRVAANADRVHLGGFSLGGLAAAWVGLSRPDAVGNVIAMSPSFWWGMLPAGVDESQTHRGRDDRPEWLTRNVAMFPRSATRFWVEMGTLENASLDFAAGVDPIATCARFIDALNRSGHVVAGYEEIPGGHDMVNWRRALPHALLTMLPDDRGARERRRSTGG